MKHRHLHKRFLVPSARRGSDPKLLGYGDRPGRPLTNATGVGLRDIAADSPETVALIASATTLCDEPECDSADLVSYAQTNHKYSTMRHAREVQAARQGREGLTYEQRVDTARVRAKQQRVNVTHDLHLVEKALTRAARGGRKPSVSAIERLEAVEALLDGPVDLSVIEAA